MILGPKLQWTKARKKKKNPETQPHIFRHLICYKANITHLFSLNIAEAFRYLCF